METTLSEDYQTDNELLYPVDMSRSIEFGKQEMQDKTEKLETNASWIYKPSAKYMLVMGTIVIVNIPVGMALGLKSGIASGVISMGGAALSHYMSPSFGGQILA